MQSMQETAQRLRPDVMQVPANNAKLAMTLKNKLLVTKKDTFFVCVQSSSLRSENDLGKIAQTEQKKKKRKKKSGLK